MARRTKSAKQSRPRAKLAARRAALLGAGYLPAELPPPFTTRGFARNAGEILKELGREKEIAADAETYSIPRGIRGRRALKIVNPLTQLRLCDCIARNWRELEQHFQSSELSISIPELLTKPEASERAIRVLPFSALENVRAERSTGYRYALITDITQFYPSIYTHSLPWALLGKDEAKARFTARKPLGIGDDLDRFARFGQLRQTGGLPIGPDSSQILAEVVAVGVDKVFRSLIQKPIDGYRYVDDLGLFFGTAEEARLALARLNEALHVFQLLPNEHKTRVVALEDLESNPWVYDLRQFNFSHRKSRQGPEIHDFFQIALAHAAKFPGESVMKFALRRVAGELIRRDNWPVFFSYLLLVAQAYPDTLQSVSQFLVTYRGLGLPIEQAALRRTLESVLNDHLKSAHHYEIAWALWMAIDNGITLAAELVQPLAKVDSSVCALLAMELDARRLISSPLDKQPWNERYSEEGFLSWQWLLVYQAARDSLLPKPAFQQVKSVLMNALLQRKVSFFNRSPQEPPLLELKNRGPNDILEMEENPNEYVDFLEVDSKYIDD